MPVPDLVWPLAIREKLFIILPVIVINGKHSVEMMVVELLDPHQLVSGLLQLSEKRAWLV